MEGEGDTYPYSAGTPLFQGSPLARALDYQSSCLEKRSFQELYNQALILQCLKYLPAYQKNPSAGRVKPPVPKFEEDETKKKVKTDGTAGQTSITTEYPLTSFIQFQGLGYTFGSNTSNDAHKVKVIKVIPETQSYAELVMATLGGAKVQESVIPIQIQTPVFSTKLEEKIDVKLEDLSESTTDGGNSPSEMPMHIAPPLLSASEALDRKDLKKFHKFVELCEDYQKRLNIVSNQVLEKFKQLAILVIPNLLSHFKSKPFEAVAAAILLYACREVDHPVTLKQIVSVADSKEKLVNKCVFTLKEILPSSTEVKHFKAGEFINVLADKLGVNEHVRSAAIKIWGNIEKLNFIKSIHAVTLASCCLKFACALSDSDKDFDTLALVAGITKMTLKNMYRELFPYRYYFITADCMLRDPKELKKL